MCNGIFGDCSIRRSNSDLHLFINSRPPQVRCEYGKLNSTDIFLENLEYAILAALCPSNNSLTLKN